MVRQVVHMITTVFLYFFDDLKTWASLVTLGLSYNAELQTDGLRNFGQ